MLILASLIVYFSAKTFADQKVSESLLLGHLAPKDDLANAESQQVAVVANHDLETAAGEFILKK